MIISGLQTGNTRWLAAHLQNAADNESVELVEVTGTVACDIDGALAEFDLYTLGTRAKEGVYAAFINPPVPLTRLQYARALHLIEQRLGLHGQPRIVVFHVKNGREHCHVVWSRIDLEHMRAIPLSFDRQKLRRCAQELAAEFGVELPPGLARDRGAERFNDPPRPTRAEKAMEATSGLSREDRRRAITECYRNADSANAFVNALETAGYMLARGDKRVFVVVDIAGDVHSLARQIEGASTKHVRKKLESLTLSLLPPVERAKVLMLQRAAAQQDAGRAHAKKAAETDAARKRLKEIHRKRRLAVNLSWQRMKVRQWHEWKVMVAHIKAEADHRLWRRYWLAAGLAAYLKKIAVIRQLIEYYETRRKRSMEEQHRLLLDSLRRRHENEEREKRRRYAALDRLERRELITFAQKFGEPFEDTLNLALIVDANWDIRFEPPRGWSIFQTDAGHIHVPSGGVAVEFQDGVFDLTASSQTADYRIPTVIFSSGANSPYSFNTQLSSFRENASDITGSLIYVRVVSDDEQAGERPHERCGQQAHRALPGM